MKKAARKESWSFFVDTGGTFTDCLGRSPDSEWFRAKVLSRGSLSAEAIAKIEDRKLRISKTDNWPDHFPIGFTLKFGGNQSFSTNIHGWDKDAEELILEDPLPAEVDLPVAVELASGWEAPVLGMRLILARQGLDWKSVDTEMRLATTRCTNALLEGKGTEPVLFITSGFGNLLEIGDQRRLGLFDLIPQKRKNLTEDIIEVDERIDRDGHVLTAPDYQEIKKMANDLVSSGKRNAVISFFHSCRNPEHEIQVAEILSEAGFRKVVVSSSIYNFPKWLPRLESGVVEAYLSDVLDHYLDQVQDALGQPDSLRVMSSAGGLQKRSKYRAIDSLLSGPAAGVVGAGSIAKSAGFQDFINLDMGGTSTDVSRYSRHYGYQSPHQVGDARIASTSLKIETVAAGGGSICRVENGLLRVGPQSSGAHPGPACYGFGGPLCLTDVNLLLGRLSLDDFSTPVFPQASRKRLDEMISSSGKSADDLLHGFLAVANDAMANAIRKISIEEGYDPATHALVAFGGAGGQHACGVAELLGMDRVLLPADSGLLSAYGLSCARVEKLIDHPFLGPIVPEKIREMELEMIARGKAELLEMGEQGEVIEKRAFIRLVGQDSSLEVIYRKPETLVSLYQQKFEQVFGYFPSHAKIELHSLRIRIASPATTEQEETFVSHGQVIDRSGADGMDRSEISPGQIYAGPLLVADAFSTLWVAEGWTVRSGSQGSLLLERNQEYQGTQNDMPAAARRELFSSRFLCLAEEMGAQLERTALSTNVSERLDFSCALLDGKGYLVANAPHIPVHLGAMGVFTRSLMEEFPHLSRGDILVANHPAYGGSHLPDVSVLAPVFGERKEPVCFLANRAHHAEIGGVSPGSMPAGSATLEQEGVVLSPQYLFEKGESRMDQIEKVLQWAEYPSRQVSENLADLSAQVASLRYGIDTMEQLIAEYGENEITQQMNALREESSLSCRHYLEGFGDTVLSGSQSLDDGDRIELQVSMQEGSAIFDFTGTAPARDDNLNATEAIVHSAVCYCLRVLIGSNLPLNEGLLEPVSLILPTGSLLNPAFSSDASQSPGVAGGNVEISQRLVDLILCTVFQEVACSQGTMNNVIFGNDKFSHYETLGGGSGARIGQEGTSAVQVHMTNTAITDPEILENRFPVRLVAFRRRMGSGGEGTWTGGDGIEREYLFEEETQLSLLTQSRVQAPQGMSGGDAGMCGEQVLIRMDGTEEAMDSLEQVTVYPGDRLVIRTPGGGGVGEAELLA
jgi:5-oxoprolinase (ATP-hydrolysing)